MRINVPFYLASRVIAERSGEIREEENWKSGGGTVTDKNLSFPLGVGH